MSAAERPLRIVLLSASYAPEATGIGPYSAELAEALAARGHSVRVVAAFPFYPSWRPQVPAGTFLYRTEWRDGVSVTRCRLFVPANPRPLLRVMHELTWALSAVLPVARSAAWSDVLLVVSPSFGSALLGALLARGIGTRVHLHVQDIVPDVAIESGQLGTGISARIARTIAGWTYRSYGSISVLSHSMAERLGRHTGRPAGANLVAPNWVRRGVSNGGRLPDNLTARPYALYAGSFGRKQDLSLLTETARLLALSHGPAIAVLGDGPGRDALEQAGNGIIRLGLVDEHTYRVVLDNALVGIVALTPGVGDSVVPSKLAAYMGAGRPVVVAADGESEAARVVGRAGCGMVVLPGRADLLADALCLLGGDAERRARLGAAGLAYARKEWDKDAIVGRLEGALIGLSARGTHRGKITLHPSRGIQA